MLTYLKNNIIPFLVIVNLTVLFFADRYRAVEVEADFQALKAGENAAVFAAYSKDGSVPDYVISYLKKLKEIAPNIVYVTDNEIKKAEVEKLKPYVTHLTAYRHGEYDWGSYKRGVAWLKDNGWSQPILPEIEPRNLKTAPIKEGEAPVLVLANDSALAVAPSFKPVLAAAQKSGADFFGITANQDGTYHLQSYFLILNKKLYTDADFAAYLNGVKKEKDGLTVAYRYEVPFTAYFEGKGYKSAAYIPYESLSGLALNDKNCYPLTLLSKYQAPFLKMRTFTERLNVQEPRRLVFAWLKKNAPEAYKELIAHLKHINSPYLKENR